MAGYEVGMFFAVLAGVTFAVYHILNRQAGQLIGVTSGMTILLATCVVLISVLLVVLKVQPGLGAVSLRGWIFLSGAGLVHFVAGLSLIALSQKSIGAARTSSLTGTTPLFATFTGFMILGEVVSWIALVGIAMIVAGAVLVSTRK